MTSHVSDIGFQIWTISKHPHMAPNLIHMLIVASESTLPLPSAPSWLHTWVISVFRYEQSTNTHTWLPCWFTWWLYSKWVHTLTGWRLHVDRTTDWFFIAQSKVDAGKIQSAAHKLLGQEYTLSFVKMNVFFKRRQEDRAYLQSPVRSWTSSSSAWTGSFYSACRFLIVKL